MNEIAKQVEEQVSESFREVATIVVFSSKMWGARVQDKDVVRDVAEQNGAETPEVGTFTKKLLAGADEEFRELCAKIREARQVHYSMTLPYAKGQALLPNARMMDYLQRMTAMKQEVKELRDKFKEVYPQRVQEAMQKLGKLADPSKYPPVDAIDSTFGIYFEFLPVPEASDFSYLPEGFANMLGYSLEKKIQSRIEAAKRIGWERLRDALEHAAEKCLSPDTKKFYQSMVDHIVDAAKVLEPMVEDGALCRRALGLCDGVTKDMLRDNVGFRKEFGERANQLADEINEVIEGA